MTRETKEALRSIAVVAQVIVTLGLLVLGVWWVGSWLWGVAPLLLKGLVAWIAGLLVFAPDLSGDRKRARRRRKGG